MPVSFFNRFNDNRARGLVYPSPFFDIAQTYMPPTVKELFKWCKFYYYTHPIINPTIFKMAEYPITELIYQEKESQFKEGVDKDEPDEETTKRYKKIFEQILDIKTFLINVGLNFFTFGNAFVSINYPFTRFVKCNSCGHEQELKATTNWRYDNFSFNITCNKCKMSGQATARDQYIRNEDMLTLRMWNPENVNIKYNDLTGASKYTYNIPNKTKKSIRGGDKDIVQGTPLEFLEAIKQDQNLEFNKDNFFHMKRHTLAEEDEAWGKPLILAAMRDAFYLQILRKANEAISLQYIVPLTVLFPQPHGSIDPYRHLNLGKWRDRIEQEIASWRDDPNYIPIMPIPIGNQQIFGNAKALMVTPEIRAISEQIVTGMGVPTEFVFGGLSYSGSSVSLRIVENHLLRYREGMLRLLRFIVDKVQRYLKLKEINVKFRDFKMADDIQQQQLVANLMQAGQVPQVDGLQQLAMDFSSDAEDKLIKENDFRNKLQGQTMISQAQAQGEAELLLARYQADAQIEMSARQARSQAKQMQDNPAAMELMMMQQGMPAQIPPEAPMGAQPGMGADPMMGQQPPVAQGEPAQAGYGPGDSEEAEEIPMDPRFMAMMWSAELRAMEKAKQQYYLAQLEKAMPGARKILGETMKRQEGIEMEQSMPTQRPPTREGGSPM